MVRNLTKNQRNKVLGVIMLIFSLALLVYTLTYGKFSGKNSWEKCIKSNIVEAGSQAEICRDEDGIHWGPSSQYQSPYL